MDLRGPGGVFWRTFLLISVLTGASLVASYLSFRILERTPRALQSAQLIVSIVNLTRSALIHSDPEKRRALLIDLAQNEDIRIYPYEPTDTIAPLPHQAFLTMIEADVRAKMGNDTRVTLSVNGRPGLWVSFFIDDDGYWVAFDADRLQSVPRLQWVQWAAIVLTLSLVGAVVISRLVNLPLKRLAAAAVAIGHGKRTARLPERGPREIHEANASFNSMVADLERIEADRALLLAGISHDLRTPLTRLRLEVELNAFDMETSRAMNSDIEQMDSIIGQFLDYARPVDDNAGFVLLDLAEVAREVTTERVPSDDLVITLELHPVAKVRGYPMELKRVLFNLIENARRYGATAGTERAEVTIRVYDRFGPALEVSDRGVGVPAEQVERLKRPFTRLNIARSEASSAGLGLAIIERIAQRHRARFELTSAPGSGFTARLVFPAAA